MTLRRATIALWATLAALLVAFALPQCPAGAQGVTTQCIVNVAAQGTSDAITSAQLPCGTTTNLVLLKASGANTTTVPTYAPIGSPALPIVRGGGGPLAVGDIAGAGYVAMLSSTGTSWVLLNPALGEYLGYAIGTSGATIPLNNGNNIESGNVSFTGTVTLPANFPNPQLFVVTSSQFGTSLCSGVSCPIGTGGDDSGPLNAISSACQSAGSCTVIFPPGAQLNVCASSWSLPTTAPISMVIRGNGKSQGGVRILPGCATSLNTVIDVPAATLGTPTVPSSVYFEIDNLRVDAYCLAPHDLVIEYSASSWAGFNIFSSLFRNVVPSLAYSSFDGGSNILVGSTYQVNIDPSNSAENENDVGHICYGAYSAGSTAGIGLFPPFLLDATNTDSQYGLQGVGSSIAGLIARYGGFNRFDKAHPWGYAATNGLSQPYSLPQYDFIFDGAQNASNLIFDSAASAGIRQQIEATSAGVDRITQVTNAGSGGTPGIVTLTGVSGTGSKWTAIGTVGPSGSLTSIPFVTYAGNYSVNPNLSAETTTATGGLTGVVVSLQMGFNSGGQGSLVSTVLSCCSTVNGISIGAGVTSFELTNSDMSSLPGQCVVLDANATLPNQIEASNNIGCKVPYSVPTASGTCSISGHFGSHGVNWLSGIFLVGTCGAGGTVVLNTTTTNRVQENGWACAFDTTNASGSTLAPTSITIVAGAAGLTGAYVTYNCRGF